jgi:hypothetical protein
MIKYDPAKGFDPDRRVEGEDAIAQKVFVRLRTHRGEWLLDGRAGLPWERWFQQKPTPLEEIKDLITLEITRVPGVKRVASASVTKEPGSDLLRANFLVLLESETDARRFSFLASSFGPFRFSLEPL